MQDKPLHFHFYPSICFAEIVLLQAVCPFVCLSVGNFKLFSVIYLEMGLIDADLHDHLNYCKLENVKRRILKQSLVSNLSWSASYVLLYNGWVKFIRIRSLELPMS